MSTAGVCSCGEPSKYRCPACDVRSCSLACVRRHKAEQACSGKRDSAKYCSVQTFDDSTLHRDFRFLEGMGRAVDSGKRTRRDTERPVAAARNGGLTPQRQNLVRLANEHGVQLELLPHGMTRQRENSTRYDGRRKWIGWRVELRFVDAGVIHVLPCVPEGLPILQLLRSCLEPDVVLPADGSQAAHSATDARAPPAAAAHGPKEADPAAVAAAGGASGEVASSVAPSAAPAAVRRDEGQRALLRHKLRAYGKAGAASLRVFMATECRRADERGFNTMPLSQTLCEALRGKALIEFPTLHVALPDETGAAGDARFPLRP